MELSYTLGYTVAVPFKHPRTMVQVVMCCDHDYIAVETLEVAIATSLVPRPTCSAKDGVEAWE